MYRYLDNLSEPLCANSKLQHYSSADDNHHSELDANKRPSSHENAFFEKLLEIHKMKQKGRKIEFSDDIKRFSMCVFITGGRSNYVQFMKCLPLPKPATLYKYYSGQCENIPEGILRARAFSEYLDRANSSKLVWLSEDATAVTSKLEYDSNFKRMIGNTYNDCPASGLPILSPSVRSAKDVKHHAHAGKLATDLNVVMAISVSADASPFCILAYGMGKSYKAESFVARVQHISHELAKHGIVVLGYSTDGASPYVKGMKQLTGLGHELVDANNAISENYKRFFFSMPTGPPFCVQDTIHLGGKLKNRFLQIGKVHRIGKFFLLPFSKLKYAVL